MPDLVDVAIWFAGIACAVALFRYLRWPAPGYMPRRAPGSTGAAPVPPHAGSSVKPHPACTAYPMAAALEDMRRRKVASL